MTNRKCYLLTSTVGLTTIAFGQYMARSQFYGTTFGRAWAPVFWLGFLLFVVPLITLFARFVANHKNARVRKTGKYQIVGITGITSFVGLIIIIAVMLGNNALTGYDAHARRGVFVIWLLLIIFFTLINLFTFFAMRLKQAKRF